MRITGLPAPVSTLLLSALRKVSDFTVPEVPQPAPPPATAAAQPVSVEMLVTLATVEPASDRRRRVAAEADRGLHALERLNEVLVAGLPPVERLAEVAAWAEELHAPQDPDLAAIFRDIELRVRVELAKHDVVA